VAPRAFRLASPQGEDASTQLLQPTTATSTQRTARFPAPFPTPGRSSFDDEPRASAWPATVAFTAAEPARTCGGLRSKSPSRAAHPVTRGFFGRGQVACLASDAPCRTLSPVIEPQGVRAPGPVPPLPRQRPRLSRSEAPGWYAPFHHPPSRAREGPRPGAASGPIMTSTSLAQGARPSERSAALPRFRGARRSLVRRPEARNDASSSAIQCDPRARPGID